MDLTESCKAIGIQNIADDLTFEQIIDVLNERPDRDERMDIQMVLGVAQQEAGQVTEAYETFCKLAKAGSIGGLFQQATYLYDGKVAERDPKRAAELMELAMMKAEEEGLVDIYQSAAECLAKHWFHFFPQETSRAIIHWTKAAADGGGSLEAMMALGAHYEAQADSTRAFHWFQNAAGKGDAVAQTRVGLMYAKGAGVRKSIPKAIDCLKTAAESGSNFARGHLAELCFRMKLFTESVRHAKSSYDQYKSGDASENVFADPLEAEGLAISCYILGRCLMLGQGAPRDADTGSVLIHLCGDIDKQTCIRLHKSHLRGEI